MVSVNSSLLPPSLYFADICGTKVQEMEVEIIASGLLGLKSLFYDMEDLFVARSRLMKCNPANYAI